MARDDPQLNIRLPATLKDRLGAAARSNIRTLNAEIVNRLERSFDSAQAVGLGDDAMSAILDLGKKVDQLLTLAAPPHAPFPFKRKKAE